MVHTHQDSNPGFTEFLSLSRAYIVPVSTQGLKSSRLHPRLTEFLSLPRVYRVPISIHFPGFTEFPSLFRVYRVSFYIQGLQSSRLYSGFTEFPSEVLISIARLSNNQNNHDDVKIQLYRRTQCWINCQRLVFIINKVQVSIKVF